MSIYRLSLVLCVFCISGTESTLHCNITLQYTYYEYILNATCETRCLFPLLGILTFRDLQVTPRELVDSNAWMGRASLTVTGSFWGEYLDCRLPGHLLICVTLIAVNRTIVCHCTGQNNIWPPFSGPFLNETNDDNYEDNYDRLVTIDSEQEKSGISDAHINFSTAFQDQLENAPENLYMLNVTEIVPRTHHITKTTCIIILTIICVVMYYLSKNGTLLHHRDRYLHRSKKKKYTPPYVAIKDI
ncbi:pr119.1 [rat cytomegalovirus strain Maastricht]|uniref:Pr119.1 n=1 Tax=Rat cytomegalovirus (strain Maastricht) TaxID=79700 RepID=Q9DW80_RCMVM|nr:pr119.1 [rat cytomegalovirus strain Maastricht]AAF99210.1 pr119.1 [rat cytomegalovirus strain Maastricht]WEG72032.1 membrane protein m119.1 [Murid betaherpesvirus 2]